MHVNKAGLTLRGVKQRNEKLLSELSLLFFKQKSFFNLLLLLQGEFEEHTVLLVFSVFLFSFLFFNCESSRPEFL